MIPSCCINKLFLFIISIIIGGFLIAGKICAQTPVFEETFSTTTSGFCDQGNMANGFATPSGTWTVTSLGVNDAFANEWFISATDDGQQSGSCAQLGCIVDLTRINRTLHIGNVVGSPNSIGLCPTGDCGPVYDPGDLSNSVQTDKRAESPLIPILGNTQYILMFNYLHYGDYPDSADRATVEFFDGSVWVPSLDIVPRTLNACGTSFEWQQHFLPLPVIGTSGNIKIGFRWMNDNGGIGFIPSISIDSIVIIPVILPVATISVSDTTVCVNQNVDFFANSAGPLASYSWTFAGGTPSVSTQQNPSGITYTNPGTYTATLVVSTSSGSDNASVSIVVNPCIIPTANFSVSDSVFCERTCVTFFDLSVDGATSWNWSFAGGIPSIVSSPVPPPICYNTPGIYDVTLVVANQFGSDSLTKTAYLNVVVCPLPVADFNSSVFQLCPQQCVSFSDNSTFGPITSYRWSFPGGMPDTSSAPNPSVCYTQEGFFDVQLIVTNQYGSDTIVKFSEVQVQFVPNAFASQDTSMNFGDRYQLFAGGGTSYQWSPSTGLSDTSGANPALIPDPVASPLSTTVYTVAITDGTGCTTFRQVIITILHDNELFVPNSFTPNGDGVNDLVYVRGNNIFGMRFTIFDRWGEKVFETIQLSGGWNGLYKGKELDPGVFTYVVTVNYSNRESVTQSGTITLIR